MAIKFFCDNCGDEIWQYMRRSKEQLCEIIDMGECLCSECLVDQIIDEIKAEEKENEVS